MNRLADKWIDGQLDGQIDRQIDLYRWTQIDRWMSIIYVCKLVEIKLNNKILQMDRHRQIDIQMDIE